MSLVIITDDLPLSPISIVAVVVVVAVAVVVVVAVVVGNHYKFTPAADINYQIIIRGRR